MADSIQNMKCVKRSWRAGFYLIASLICQGLLQTKVYIPFILATQHAPWPVRLCLVETKAIEEEGKREGGKKEEREQGRERGRDRNLSSKTDL